MMLGSKTRQDVMVLSQGQTWVAAFFPSAGGIFPPGTTAECIITDPAGGVLATWLPMSIAETRIDFITAAAGCDPIPHGSYYRVTVHYPAIGDRPPIDDNLSRGSVVRDDNPTPLAAPQTSDVALSFNDPVTGPEVNPNWVKVGGWGNLKVFDNSASSLPNGMAGDSLLFAQAAARWRVQSNRDAVKLEVGIVTGAINPGRTTTIVASNQAMTSWIGYQIRTDTSNWNPVLNIVRGSGPTTYSVIKSVPNAVASNGRYTFIYDDLTDTYLAYKENDFSAPLTSWPDAEHEIPHGNGYRYAALLFEANLLTTGVQVAGWSMKDN